MSPVHLDRVPPASAAPDFWRSGATNVVGALPDNVNDTTELIHREGRVAVQNALGSIPPFAANPAFPPLFEVANNGRSGTDRRSIQDVIYATGNIGPGAGNWATPNSAWIAAGNGIGKSFLGHSNQTAGFAFGYQTIQQVSDTLDFVLTADQGIHSRQNLRLNGGWMYDMQVLDAAAVIASGQGWQARWRGENGDRFIELRRKNTGFQGGANGYEFFFQMQRPDGGFVNHHRASWSFRTPNVSTFQFNPNNQLGDQLIQLFGDSTATSQTYGFGMRGAEMTAWINAGSTFTTRRTDTDVRIFSVSAFGANGDAVIDPDGLTPAGWANGLFRFGALNSGEGIKSQRTGAGTRFHQAIEFYVESTLRFALRNASGANGPGRIYIRPADVPTFASDAAAAAAGMLAGDLFRDALGGLHIKL